MTELFLLTVAPAHRVGEVEELIKSLNIPKDRAIVVAHEPDFLRSDIATVIDYPFADFNISKWWDYGLEHIRTIADILRLGRWDIAVIESDVRMTRTDVDIIRETMREHDCVMAGADWQNCLEPGEVKVRKDNSAWVSPGKEAWQSRLPGMGVVVAGEAELDHAPLYPRFWFADDHIEWKARESGGTILVGGTTLHHTGTQGPLTGDLKDYAAEDDAAFISHWKGHPANGGKY